MKANDKKLIANFMGYERGEVGYTGTDSETKWQRKNADLIDELDIQSIGIYWIDRNTMSFFEDSDLDYTDWNVLIGVVKKIEGCSRKMPVKFPDIKIAYAVTRMRLIDPIEEVIVKVVGFIKWYNEKKF